MTRKAAKYPILTLLIVVLSAMVIGCSPVSSQETPGVQPSATAQPASTATIQWFPPTATPTIAPTQGITPTVDQHPGLGQVIIQDDFSNTTLWDTGEREAGKIGYSQNKLTLAISQPAGVLYSFRKSDVLTDFYLTMQVNPVLCKQSDVYGILFRVNSTGDFYRLLINCNGLLRLERLRNSEVTILQDWISSGQVAAGAPLNYQIGIWAFGSDLRIFAEDVFQFAVRDNTFPQGWLGVYARSMGTNVVTINFSSLQIQALSR